MTSLTRLGEMIVKKEHAGGGLFTATPSTTADGFMFLETDRFEANTARVETGYGSHYVAVAHLFGDISHAKYSSPGKFDNTAVIELLDKFFDRINRQISASKNLTAVHMPEFVLQDHAIDSAIHAMFQAFISAINIEISDIRGRFA